MTTIHHAEKGSVIYALYDVKAKVYGVPMVYSEGDCPQQFLSMLVNTSGSGMLHTHAEDFILYRIGSITEKGKVITEEHEIHTMCAGLRKKVLPEGVYSTRDDAEVEAERVVLKSKKDLNNG